MLNERNGDYLPFFTRLMAGNIAKTMGGRLAASGLYFVVCLSLMSSLTLSEYGEFTYYYSLMAATPFFLDLGTNKAFVSYCSVQFLQSKKEGGKAQYSFIVAKAMMALLWLSVIFALWRHGYFGDLVFWSLASGLLFGAQEGLASTMVVAKRFTFLALMMPVRNIVMLSGLVFYGFSEEPLTVGAMVVLLFVSSTVSFFTHAVSANTFCVASPREALGTIKLLIERSRWLVLSVFALTFLMRFEVYALRALASLGRVSLDELGVFSGAFTLSVVLPLMTTAAVKVLLPSVSEITKSGEAISFVSSVRDTIPMVLLLNVFLVLCTTTLVYCFFREKFFPSIEVYWVLSLSAVAGLYTQVLQTLFYAANSTKEIAKIHMTQLLSGILLGGALMYCWGALGAAFSVLSIRLVGLGLTRHCLTSVVGRFNERESDV
jgi:O-antigen/teichoic acid export membrane protein